ncbi:MAG: YitT family protein [Chitinophagales bacterium]|nr:YitT family protein [Bacteroidota bacterium]
MNSWWKKVFINNVFKDLKRKGKTATTVTQYELARRIQILKINVKFNLKSGILLLLGVLSAGFGLKSFLLPSEFIDGGAVGISLLIAEISNLPLPILLIIINLPFVFLGFKTIGNEFAIKTILGIIALAIAVAVIPYPIITEDKLLVAIFGGFFLGIGIGLAMRGGGVIDGTEVLAINISKRIGTSVGDIILIINIIIFSVAAYVLSLETAMYSILTYLAASKTVDFILEGIEEYTGVTVISKRSETIRKMITEKLGRGVTIINGKSGYGTHGHSNNAIDIVYTVVTRLEVSKLNSEIEKIDKDAFIVMSSIRDTKGGMIKKRVHKHD